MMRNISSAVLASLMLLSLVTSATAEKAVTFAGAIQPAASAEENHFVVTVELDIKEGWHTYADAGEGSGVQTSLKMKLPEGVKAKGDWSRPVGIESADLHSQVYIGRVKFSRSVIVEPNAYGQSIEVVVSYQACTDEYCNPPQTKEIGIAIPEKEQTDPSIFESPVRINADGVPLNSVAKTMFPSPAIFDVDGDGQAELVIGSLMGSVGVYENLNTSGTGDPAWGKHESLRGADGSQIRTSNW